MHAVGVTVRALGTLSPQRVLGRHATFGCTVQEQARRPKAPEALPVRSQTI